MNTVIQLISSWIVNIVVLFIIVSIAELIMPKGNMKRYIELVIGILIVFTIISPIARIFDYDFRPKHTIYDYTKEQEMKIKEGNDFYISQDYQIRSLVIQKMKSEITNLVENEGDIKIHDIDIGIDIRDEDHKINYINLVLGEEVKNSDISIKKISKIKIDDEADRLNMAETDEYLGLREKIGEFFSVSSEIISIKTIEKRDVHDERDN